MLAVFCDHARTGLAKILYEKPLHIAWGSGKEEWEENPPHEDELFKWTKLQAEFGRRCPSVKSFVLPDLNGEIIVPTGEKTRARYTLATEPTPYIYLQAQFDFNEAPNKVVRELGIFVDTQVSPDCLPGQQYFTPNQIVDCGELLVCQAVIPGIVRSKIARQRIDFVLPL